MWLTCSSIGRKFVMALTGVCLVLFVTFHVLMNSVALLWPAAYNQVCMFLGANWYALVASIGLAALFIIHIIYAVWLTVQNRAARGADRYDVESRPAQVEWSSKNMLVLGLVVLAFLVVHLMQFWYKMQYQELIGSTATVDGVDAAPEFGTLFLQAAFSQIWTPIVYIIGFVALWFHMNHGFWSMFQSIGWNNTTWLPRLKCISCWWTSIVVLLFVAQAVVFTIQAKDNYFLTAPALQEQYAQHWAKKAQVEMTAFQESMQSEYKKLAEQPGMDQYRLQQGILDHLKAIGMDTYTKLNAIVAAADKQCPDVDNETIANAKYMVDQLAQELGLPADNGTVMVEEEALDVVEEIPAAVDQVTGTATTNEADNDSVH